MSWPDDVEGAFARLQAGLDSLPDEAISPPNATRLGATLVLLYERNGGIEAVYTRRHEDLRSHPGQISFPGGRVDEGETVEDAAVREAVEEVALDPASVEILGRLPTFYIPPSRFWLSAVVARWHDPHDLVPAEAEVAEVLHVPFSLFADPDSWRVVRLSSMGWSWAWQLPARPAPEATSARPAPEATSARPAPEATDGDHILWGATAIVTAVVLGMLDPDWAGGQSPDTMPDREVRPWEVRLAPTPGPARLRDVAEMNTAEAGFRDDDQYPSAVQVEAAGRLLADAVARLDAADPVLVLAGDGGNGDAARDAAKRLADRGREVVVVEPATFDGTLPAAGVVLDGLVGGGLRPPLRATAMDMLNALRLQHVPTIAVDLPSGVDPQRGLAGETFTADVTVSLGPPWPGVFVPGLAPFVGDLYAPDPRGELVRLVGAPLSREWAE